VADGSLLRLSSAGDLTRHRPLLTYPPPPLTHARAGFTDNGRLRSTTLNSKLKAAGIKSVFVVGLALDYCVKWTALDAVDAGYKVYVVLNATAPVANATGVTAIAELKAKGVTLVDTVADAVAAMPAMPNATTMPPAAAIVSSGSGASSGTTSTARNAAAGSGAGAWGAACMLAVAGLLALLF
jgi:hypothetical protein